MASGCGHWVWSLGGALNDVISGQCVTSLPCFQTFLQLAKLFLHNYVVIITIMTVMTVSKIYFHFGEPFRSGLFLLCA